MINEPNAVTAEAPEASPVEPVSVLLPQGDIQTVAEARETFSAAIDAYAAACRNVADAPSVATRTLRKEARLALVACYNREIMTAICAGKPLPLKGEKRNQHNVYLGGDREFYVEDMHEMIEAFRLFIINEHVHSPLPDEPLKNASYIEAKSRLYWVFNSFQSHARRAL